jgi:dihydrofolate reductase
MTQSPVVGAVGHLHLVVAFDQVGGIGKDGKIPWFLPPDLKRFKELTSSLPEGGNPGSFNIVIMVILKSSMNASLSNF